MHIRKGIHHILIFLTAIGCHHAESPAPSMSGLPIAVGDLNHSPLDQSSFKSLVPLGSLNPSSHTFPTDHMYFYLANTTVEVPVYAPGDLVLYRISQDQSAVGTANEVTDYGMDFGSDESYLEFAHVARLTDAMASTLDFTKGDCQTYTLGNGSVQKKCYLQTDFKVKAGDIVGYCGKAFGQGALDMGLYVKLVAACPLDYYTEPTRSELTGRLSSYDGLVKRTVPPLCGTVDQNKPNTAQGIWLNPGKPKYPESEHIALVHDNIDPALPAFSVGLSFAGVTSGVYYFTPEADGLINRDFGDVVADGQVYCYTYHTKESQPTPHTSILLRLEDPKTLKIEKRTCDCTCMPYAFKTPLTYRKE